MTLHIGPEIDLKTRWLAGEGLSPRHGQALLGLLAALARAASLREAAHAAGLSYRHAWGLLGTGARALGAPLVAMQRGKGARLTAYGLKLLEADAHVRTVLDTQLERLRREVGEMLATAAPGQQSRLSLQASHDLALPLLATACVTFRQEYRWLYAPYLLLLLGAAWALGRWRPLKRKFTDQAVWVGCCSMLVVAGLTVEVTYRQYAENTYFFGAQAAADSVYDQVFVHDRSRLVDTTLLIETKGDQTFTNWIMLGGGFFTTYAKGIPLDIRLLPSQAAIRQQNKLRSHVRLLVWNGHVVVPTPLPR